MAAQLASSWCPGALKGQLVAHGSFVGGAAAQSITPATATYSAIALPAAVFVAGGATASPIPAANVVISLSSDSAAIAGVILGASVTNPVTVNGVAYTSSNATGDWFTVGALTTTVTYDYKIFG
jgi:hypothetical protein